MPSRSRRANRSCNYPGQSSSHLALVLLDLLELNPSATVLLAMERRPLPPHAPAGTNYYADFFDAMSGRSTAERVPEGELDAELRCDEIALWRFRTSKA